MTDATSSYHFDAADCLKIGQLLRQARVQKGMSIEELSTELHLRIRQVDAIERGDFSGFSSPAFVKGHLRAWGRLCALDGDALVQLYDATLPVQKPVLPPPVVLTDRWIVNGVAVGRSTVAYAASAVIVICLLLGVWLLPRDYISRLLVDLANTNFSQVLLYKIQDEVVGDQSALDKGSVPAATQQPVSFSIMPVENPVPSVEVFPDDLSAKKDTLPSPEVAEPVLHLEFSDDCWVQLKNNNGVVLHEQVHKKGDVFDLPVKTPLHIWFGRADSVNVNYNGAVVAVPVKQGFQSVQFILGDESPLSEIE
jgi:cytoskeleton protein RodZ